MNEKNIKLFKQINIWVYIIPFFLITALFSLRTYNAVEQKITDSYEHFTEDAADAARNYSYTLKKAAEADKIINDLCICLVDIGIILLDINIGYVQVRNMVKSFMNRIFIYSQFISSN